MKPYYEARGVSLYLGDMRDVLPQLELTGERIVITDPPYNAGKNYGKTTNDRQSWPEWCAWWDGCLDVLLAASPDVLAFLSQTASRWYTRLGQRMPDWECMVWYKPLSMAVCALPFMPHWEPITYWGSTRKKDGAFWGSDVLVCNVEFGKSRHGHPTPKPEKLMLDLVSRFQGLIIDPFAGAGTTLLAALQLERRAVGVEISEAYCEGIARRLENDAPLLRYNNAEQGALL